MYKVYKIMYVYKCMMYIYAHTHVSIKNAQVHIEV